MRYDTEDQQHADARLREQARDWAERLTMPPTEAPVPTPEARDLAADLDLCERATPGQWLHNDHYACVQTHSEAVPLAAVCYDGNAGNPSDGEMIAAARTGWPAAIKRALRAEARVAQLEAQVATLRLGAELARELEAGQERVRILQRAFALDQADAGRLSGEAGKE